MLELGMRAIILLHDMGFHFFMMMILIWSSMNLSDIEH